MIISFLRTLEDDTGFLQEICPHFGTGYVEMLIKVDFNEFSKPTTVIISGGFRISNGLKITNINQKIHPWKFKIRSETPNFEIQNSKPSRSKILNTTKSMFRQVKKHYQKIYIKAQNRLHPWLFQLQKIRATDLHDRVGGQNTFLHVGFSGGSAGGGEIPHGISGADSFSGARLPGNDNGLVFVLSKNKKVKLLNISLNIHTPPIFDTLQKITGNPNIPSFLAM